ncbi:MAG: hypothetical protein WA958_05135 [Tunicatimonas sp.]
MEDELKKLWKEENKRLESKIEVNEKLIREMNMDKHIKGYDKLLSLSILGRNFALVYCFISVALAINVVDEPWYTIPAVVGGLAMLASFVSHLSLRKPDYEELSLIDLQKVISKFRIHTASRAKYDGLVVAFWFLTAFPPYLNVFFGMRVYSDIMGLATFCLLFLVAIAIGFLMSRSMYQKYEQQLKQSEAYLAAIADFENS